jgi:hypothetical protein
MGAATLDIVLYYAMVLRYALMLSFENDEHLPRQARGKHENENGLLTKAGALLLLFYTGNWPPTNSSLFRACTAMVEGHKGGSSAFDLLKKFLGEYAGAKQTKPYP